MKRIRGALSLILAGTLGAAGSGAYGGEPAQAGRLEDECAPPPELRGARGHFLFDCTSNPAPGVDKVQLVYASVDPEADREPFVSHLTDCVRERGCGSEHSSKAFVPGILGLHYFGAAPADAPEIDMGGGRVLPLSRLEELGWEKLKLAEYLLRGRRFKSSEETTFDEFRGSGWTLLTDAREARIEAVRAGVEFAYRAFETAFPGVPEAPESARMTVVVFKGMSDFDHMVSFDNLTRIRRDAGGLYNTIDRMIYTTLRGISPENAARTLSSQTAAHLLFYRVYRGERPLPQWVMSGVTEYIQLMARPAGPQIDLAAVDFDFYTHAGVWARYPIAVEYPGTLKQAFKKNRQPKAADLANEDPALPLFRQNSKLAGAASWLLVHYLINAEGGRHREAFRRWLVGDPPSPAPSSTPPASESSALERALGRPLAEIDALLPAHFKSVLDQPSPSTTPAQNSTPAASDATSPAP